MIELISKYAPKPGTNDIFCIVEYGEDWSPKQSIVDAESSVELRHAFDEKHKISFWATKSKEPPSASP